jgi:hypothetical protein
MTEKPENEGAQATRPDRQRRFRLPVRHSQAYKFLWKSA